METFKRNRERLDRLGTTFGEWLHLEDQNFLYTVTAIKLTHKIPGDPVWIQFIGPSSGGKSEMLRAFTQEGEIKVDDLTEHTFISGFKVRGEETEQFVQTISNKIWYIYDLSILMSKSADERTAILSDLRMIYDGHISKKFGNQPMLSFECPNNTLICGTTPAIDNTILEDQQMGTRFIVYRIKASNRQAMMDMIDKNQDRLQTMRETLNLAVREYEKSLELTPYILTDLDNQNLQLLCNLTTLLRTSVATDRFGEPMNLCYPEEPGRFYKQIKKVYCAFKMMGLSDDETLKAVRKLCTDNVNPIRQKLLRFLYDNTKYGGYDQTTFTTSYLHQHTGLGKKTVKTHMHQLNMLGLVSYKVEEDQYGRIIKEVWTLNKSNLNLLLSNNVHRSSGKSCWPIYANRKKKQLD